MRHILLFWTPNPSAIFCFFLIYFTLEIFFPISGLYNVITRLAAKPWTFVTWPSGTARRWQILRDGFDSRLEPFALTYITGGCWLDERKLTSQFPSISVEYSVQYNLKISSAIYLFSTFCYIQLKFCYNYWILHLCTRVRSTSLLFVAVLNRSIWPL